MTSGTPAAGGHQVAIAGAGAIAFGTAALIEQSGHRATLWSPSGASTRALAGGAPLTAEGAIEGEFRPSIADSAPALLQDADSVLIALPAYGHKAVFDALGPHLRSDQVVIISSHASFGALYLSRLLAMRGIELPIVSMGTTVTSGRKPGATRALVNTVREKIDITTLPSRRHAEGLMRCDALFGPRFVERDGLLAISLSNLNPQNHMGIALGNMTRMERGENWSQGLNVTPKVGQLLEALDRERLAIAEALQLDVRSIFEHFHLSFHVPVDSVSAMNQRMHQQGRGGTGPATADSRYVTEDVPFGLCVTERLGALCGRPAALHGAGIDIFGAMYGRDFRTENDLLSALDMDTMTLAQLEPLARHGFFRPG